MAEFRAVHATKQRAEREGGLSEVPRCYENEYEALWEEVMLCGRVRRSGRGG